MPNFEIASHDETILTFQKLCKEKSEQVKREPSYCGLSITQILEICSKNHTIMVYNIPTSITVLSRVSFLASTLIVAMFILTVTMETRTTFTRTDFWKHRLKNSRTTMALVVGISHTIVRNFWDHFWNSGPIGITVKPDIFASY